MVPTRQLTEVINPLSNADRPYVDAISRGTLPDAGMTFEIFCYKNYSDVHNYFDNPDNRYSEFKTVCSYIKREIRKDQIEGGMVGQYNTSITQRLNNLTEKSDITTNGKDISEIKVNIITSAKD